MNSSTEIRSPSSEAATTEGVAQAVAEAEAETIELSPLSTPLASIADAAQPQSGNSPSSGSIQSRRASATWSIVKLPSFSTFYSVASRSSGLLRRYKTSIYKNSFKILGLLCELGALTLAWIALKSPTNPDDIDIQSLATLNKSADSQMAIYKVLQESLSKLQEELAIERKQLETDREVLRNEANQLGLQRWAAQRQFIKDCLDYQKVSPPPESLKVGVS